MRSYRCGELFGLRPGRPPPTVAAPIRVQLPLVVPSEDLRPAGTRAGRLLAPSQRDDFVGGYAGMPHAEALSCREDQLGSSRVRLDDL